MEGTVVVQCDDIVIVAAKRTAMGKFRGALGDVDAVSMAATLCTRMLADARIDPVSVDQVIVGNVLAAGNGQNVARQVQIRSGMSEEGTAMSVNQVCGSGLKAVRLAQSAIAMGDAGVVVAGGTESMSRAPGLAARTGKGSFGTDSVADSLFVDGLNDAFDGYPVGQTAENLSRKFGLTRERIDGYALDSQARAARAWRSGWFDDEIVPVAGLDHDESIRPDTSMEGLAALRPVYGADGVVTAGNASPISDGAALVALTDMRRANAMGLRPLARITGYAETGYKPELMGYTPVLAIRKLLEGRGQSVDDIDLFEVNEAFAAQALVVRDELGIDPERYNICGGAVALGHPLGASGARILTTLIHSLRRIGKSRGIASLCVGGGQGIAMEVEVW